MGKRERDDGGQEKEKKRRKESRASGHMPINPAAMMGGGLPGMAYSPFLLQQQQQQQQWAAYVAYMSGHKKKKKEKKKKKRKRESTSSSESEADEAAAATSVAQAPEGMSAGEERPSLLSRASRSRSRSPLRGPAMRAEEAGAPSDGQTGLDEWIASTSPAAAKQVPPTAAQEDAEVDEDDLTGLDVMILKGAPAEKAAEGEAPAAKPRQKRSHGWDEDQAPAAPAQGSDASAPATEAATEKEVKNTNLQGALISANANIQGGPPEKLHGDSWEEPRSQTGLKLIGEEAPENMAWNYVLKDESRRSFVGFLPRTLGTDVCASFFEKARDGANWMQPMGPNGPIPRKTAWMVYFNCDCHYRYGRIEVRPQQYPPWMCTLMHWVMPCCGINEQKDWPNSCNLNLYEGGGMSVGWHADDEQLFQGKFRDTRIISLSLGARRAFEVRMNWSDASLENSTVKLMLGDGDLCTMEGMVQKHFQHRVPRESAEGDRINLTWRWIVKHTPRCPAARERKPPPPPPPPPPAGFR